MEVSLFGKKKSKTPSTADAVQELHKLEHLLTTKQEFLESKIQQEISTARKNAASNKRVAILALKRKKRYEKQLQQLDGTLSTLEMQREALQSASTNVAVLATMKNAADAIKAANKSMDVDKVHDMMDDIAEQNDLAQEITDAISRPVAFGSDVDEDELERELAELEQEQLDRDLLAVGGVNELPAVEKPAAKKKKKQSRRNDDDDDEMKELEAWAA